jgi:general stress protein 26
MADTETTSGIGTTGVGPTTTAQLGIDNAEKLAGVKLDTEGKAELLRTASELTFIFNNASGWPTGVVMSFLEHEGTFYVTATSDRNHVKSLASDPRVSITISNQGTTLPGRQMLSLRCVAIVHKDRETLDWFLPRFTTKLGGKSEAFAKLLDSPARVVVELRPVAVTASHDSRKMPGDGRGDLTTGPPINVRQAV